VLYPAIELPNHASTFRAPAGLSRVSVGKATRTVLFSNAQFFAVTIAVWPFIFRMAGSYSPKSRYQDRDGGAMVVRDPKAGKRPYIAPTFEIVDATSARAALNTKGVATDPGIPQMLSAIDEQLDGKTLTILKTRSA
jgi:hypothetical protein